MTYILIFLAISLLIMLYDIRLFRRLAQMFTFGKKSEKSRKFKTQKKLSKLAAQYVPALYYLINLDCSSPKPDYVTYGE